MSSKLCPKCRRRFDDPDRARCDADGRRLIEDRVGTLVADRYEVETFIGVGAAGTVWEALDHRGAGGRVALKLLPAKNVGEAQRFERGARLVAGLAHKNIAATVGFGKDGEGEDALHWIVMELLAGETLADLQTREKTLDAKAAVVLVGEVLNGLEHAHASGIVHRDLKPSNVFITTNGVPKILDFGIAKQAGAANERALADGAATADDNDEDSGSEVTGQDKICGTPEYMPPEQILGAPADVRSDLYAVGVILYKLVSGVVPFRSRSRQAVYHQHLHAAVPALVASEAVPQAFIEALDKALAKAASDRFASARAMHEALRAAVGLPSLAPLLVGPDPLASAEDTHDDHMMGPAPMPLIAPRPKRSAKRVALAFFWASLAVLLAVLAVKLLDSSSAAAVPSAAVPNAAAPAGEACPPDEASKK